MATTPATHPTIPVHGQIWGLGGGSKLEVDPMEQVG